MTTFEELWPKLKRSKRYREAFVTSHAKREIGFQIRELLKQQNDMTQTELARRAGLTQGVVSRAADPAYGNLTINTLVRIAAGFDVAFVGRFVPFSELPKWFDRIYSDKFEVATFDEEDAALSTHSDLAMANLTTEQVRTATVTTTSTGAVAGHTPIGATSVRVVAFAPMELRKYERKGPKSVFGLRLEKDWTKASTNA